MDRELNAFAPNERGTRVWRTFDSRPRFGNNYAGLRNRISILSEAYSYLDFAGRVRVTEAFVEEIMRFVGANASEVRSIVAAADADTTRIEPATEAGVAFALRALLTPVDILVGAVETVPNPRSGRLMTRMVESIVTPTRMQDYGLFAATRTRRVPRSYVVAASPSGVHERVASKLREHGVRVDSLAGAATMSGEVFVLDTVTRVDRPFQGHQEVSVTGRFERRDVGVPAASIVVRTDQPLGRLVFYLLEPESDDSLATWNLLDDVLKPGAVHPVMKVF
jgi:hypothetical protein